MNLTVLRDGSEQICYNIPEIPVYISRSDLRSMSNMAALCHWHDDVELLLAVKGHLSYNINGTTVDIPQGHAIFVNARQMHYGYSADGTDCKYVCITFRPQFLCGNEELSSRFILPILSASSAPYLILSPTECSDLPNQMYKIESLYRDQPEGFELEVFSCLLGLWHSLYRKIRLQLADDVAEDSNLLTLRQMLDCIRTQYSEKLPLNTIASAGGVCRTTCCQLFRKYLGMTPNDYLNSFRLAKSMEMLNGTSLTITEIAAACGFASASYYAELFTRQKGCTPTQFRRQSASGASRNTAPVIPFTDSENPSGT